MTPEVARGAGVAEGSLPVFYPREGQVSAEILPPPTGEAKEGVRESVEKFGGPFAEPARAEPLK